MNCIFTICATNYIGLAKILGNSIKEFYNDFEFYIIVADEPKFDVRNSFDSNILIAKDILGYDESKWYEMAFKYDITEFCTSIKPKTLLYMLSKGFDKVIYFDPDIMFFSSVAPIFDALDNYSAVVTPHLLTSEEYSTGALKERYLLHSGVFNLGFVAFKKNTKVRRILTWWSKRLEDCCFNSSSEPFFTDQKWMDLLPCFLGNDLFISSSKGMNMAPWNFHERKVIRQDENLIVGNRILSQENKDKLVFVHFSGFKYKDLVTGNINRIDSYSFDKYPDLDVLFELYANQLKKGDFNEYINNEYSYNCFNNSSFKVNGFVRRLYRAYKEQYDYSENPFSEKSYFYKVCLQNKLIKKNVIAKPLKYADIKSSQTHILGLINIVLTVVFRVVGIEKYRTMLKAFKVYSEDENHYFLIKKKKQLFSVFRAKY